MKHFTIKLGLAFLFLFIITLEGRSQISGTSPVLNVTANTATVVDAGLTITQTGNISDFNVQITEGYIPGASGDILSYTGSLPSGVISNFDQNLGILHFTGTTVAANWQTLLRTVTLKTSSATCSNSKKRVTFVIGNTFYNPANNHYYKTNIYGAFANSKSTVESSSYYGRTGYLATVTSSDENNFIFRIVEPWTFPYLGASDDYQLINAATGTTTYANQASSEGNYYWISGPEAGTEFTSNGAPMSGQYNNWSSNQPDDNPSLAVGEQNYIIFSSIYNNWDDDGGTTPYNCIAEYGGMPNDNETNMAHSTRTIIVSGAPGGMVNGDAYVCTGSSSATFTLIPPAGGYSSITRWESSVDKYFTNPTIITNTTATLNLSGLSTELYYRAIVSTSSPSCSNIPTSSAKVILNNANGSWIGSTSNNWTSASNWCGGVPSLSADIIIPAGTPFVPFIPYNVSAACRNLKINAGGVLADSGNLQIGGAITCYGMLNASYGTSTVEFKGSSQQTIPTSVPYINNLKINNASGVKLETNLNVGGLLTLNNGIITVGFGNQLVMMDNATVSGGSNASHVNGKVVKKGTAPFLFPVGRKGKYAPCELAGGYATSEDFSAEYFRDPYSNLSVSGLSKVSGKECWLINHLTNGNVGTNISLYSYDTAFSGISDYSNSNNLIVAHFNTANQYWEDLGGARSITNLPGGAVKVLMSVSNFSPFTFGSPTGLNALPVKLINFVAIPDNVTKTVELNWETATEENSKYYEVLHSVDFVKWTSLGKVNAKGSGNMNNNYSFNHINPSAVNHYKLKEVAMNGNYSYSEIKLAKFADAPADRISIYPNPSSGSLTIANAGDDTNYEICDVTGKLIQSGNFSQSTQIQNLPKGIYFVKLISEGNIQNEKVIVQ